MKRIDGEENSELLELSDLETLLCFDLELDLKNRATNPAEMALRCGMRSVSWLLESECE